MNYGQNVKKDLLALAVRIVQKKLKACLICQTKDNANIVAVTYIFLI